MTLQQLKYVTTVAQTGTISDAAKKLFISQPMRGKTDEEILRERNEAITIAKDIMKDDIEVIDSFR